MNYVHLLITPISNVVDKKVVNDKLVDKKVMSSDSIIDVYDIVKNENESIKLINISLYDNLLILEGVKYHILKALWKPEKI